MDPAPWNVQSGGIAACDARLDDRGQVTAADLVQDVPPYGAMLCDAVRAWRFEPAGEGGQAVASRVLVLGFFRPPATAFAAPDAPRYKSTSAPEELPWPTSVAVPPYPPNALGSGMVVLEADVSDRGQVTQTRILSSAGAFDSAASQAVAKWVFRPARRLNREVPSRAFLVISFVGTIS
jgi:TonB family protein